MNNPIVKLGPNSIIKCWFGLWTKSTCSFCSVCCVQWYLLPFSYHLRFRFSLPLIKITARIETDRKCNETDKGRGSKSTNHHTYTDLSLTIVFSKWSGLLHWLLAAKWRTCVKQFVWVWTSELAHTLLREKEEKTKFWGRLVESVVFQKTVIESTFDYGIEAKYDYWIVHFMNGLLNQQTKSFSH